MGSIASIVGALFVCCMACHGELARLRPGRAHLTRYYVALSAGSAVGGAFVAVCAPLVFRRNVELPLGGVATAAVLAAAIWTTSARWTAGRRELVNGTTVHGAELLDPARSLTATTYYGAGSGIGRAIRAAQTRSHSVAVGVVGLGGGVLGSDCRPGDSFHFYELNPLVEQIARSWFHFLDACAGAHVSIGDGRLLLEGEPPGELDVLALDAFSSDAIPVHLLTLEALRSFLARLAPDGVLAVHVSNRYLDLEPVVARAAEDLGNPALLVDDDGGDDEWVWESHWILIGNDPTSLFVATLVEGDVRAPKTRPDVRAWTDSRSDLWRLLK